jgi:hypothetical protein
VHVRRRKEIPIRDLIVAGQMNEDEHGGGRHGDEITTAFGDVAPECGPYRQRIEEQKNCR